MSTRNETIVKRGDLPYANPADIVRRKGWNPRFDMGEIGELEALIETHGFLKARPLEVRWNEDGKLELIDGDRRLTAVENIMKRGKWPKGEGVPVVIQPKSMTDEQALVNTIILNGGKSFLPLEEAIAYDRLVKMGKTPKEVAKLVQKSEQHVKFTLALIDADESVKEAVAKGKIGGVLAKHIANKAKGNNAKQKELVEKATQGKAGKKAAREEVDAVKKRASSKRVKIAVTPLTPAALEAAEEREQKVLNDRALACGVAAKEVKAYVSGSDDRMLAFSYGVALALRFARGLDVVMPS